MAPKVAALVVKADDTGRVLMVQRAEDNHNDAAAGRWEWPGGHLDGDEDPIEAAKREWAEETGAKVPKGNVVGSWTANNGEYVAFVYVVKHEADVDLDVDSGEVEAAAWFYPADLPNSSVVRTEVHSSDWALIGSAKKAVGPIVAVDLDGTINSASVDMDAILRGLKAQGWYIAILTGVGKGLPFSKDGLRMKQDKVEGCGIDYWDTIVLVDGGPAEIAAAKARWCEEHGVRIAIDNSEMNATRMVDSKVQLVLVPWVTRRKR